MVPLLLKGLLAALLFTAVQNLAGFAYGQVAPEPIPVPDGNVFAWGFAINLLYVALFAWITLRSRVSGWRLGLLLGALMCGILHLASAIEAWFFDLFGAAQAIGLLLTNVVATSIVIPLFVLLFGREPSGTDPQWTARLSPLRLALGAFLYLIAYYAAGICVIMVPAVREFYAAKSMPNGLAVTALQLFVRGPLFVTLLLLLLRTTRTQRGEAILMAAGTLTILGGATLLIPNPFLPGPVRMAHLVEVGVSNFLYGFFVGWLLTRARPERAPDAEPREVMV